MLSADSAEGDVEQVVVHGSGNALCGGLSEERFRGEIAEGFSKEIVVQIVRGVGVCEKGWGIEVPCIGPVPKVCFEDSGRGRVIGEAGLDGGSHQDCEGCQPVRDVCLCGELWDGCRVSGGSGSVVDVGGCFSLKEEGGIHLKAVGEGGL